MKEILKKLCAMRAVSGFEYRASDDIAELFEPYADEVYRDNIGNLIAVKRCGRENAKKLMIEAHMDEIGLAVRDIDDDGFISFVRVGGIDPRILPAAEVIVHAKRDLKGVIGAKPPHLQEAGEASKATKIKDMTIDVCLAANEVRDLVSVGDSITLCGDTTELMGGILSGKTMDDRACVAILIKTMQALSRVKTEVDVYAVCAVCEEVGGRGAVTAGFEIMPDIAVALDVTHAITPDNSRDAFELGSGVAISVGPNIHPALYKRLSDTANAAGIKHTTEVEGGDTGTDAWLLQVCATGIPTALLSVPLRYMHTSVETLDMADMQCAKELLARFAAELGEDMEEWLCI